LLRIAFRAPKRLLYPNMIRLFALAIVLAHAALLASATLHMAAAPLLPAAAAGASGAALLTKSRSIAAPMAATQQPQRASSIVVLVSFGRSGSTFVGSLLASHPLVHFAPGEPWNESCPPEELRVSARCRGRRSGDLAVDRASFCGAVRAAQANSTAIDSVSVLYEALARSNPPPSNACPSSSSTSVAAGGANLATNRVTTVKPPSVGSAIATPPKVRGFKVLYSQLWTAQPRDPCSAYSPGSDVRLAYTRISKVHGRGRPAARSLTSEGRAPPLHFEHIRSPIADGAARYGARVVLLLRANKLAHYLALQSAARIVLTRSGSLHCERGRAACVVPPAKQMYVRVACAGAGDANGTSRAAARPRPAVCDVMPLTAFGGDETRYASFPWRATLPGSPLQCACLSAFIQISTREDALTARGLQARGLAVLSLSYESLLAPARTAGGMAGVDAICSIFSFLDLPCRDARGRLLAVAGTRRLHSRSPAQQIVNVDEVAAYLEGQGMRWMLH
jgi:hypothetical protein